MHDVTKIDVAGGTHIVAGVGSLRQSHARANDCSDSPSASAAHIGADDSPTTTGAHASGADGECADE
jgi:hypothetical protein